MASMLTVLADRYQPGGSRGLTLPLGEALERVWRTDAHAQQGPSNVRVTKKTISEARPMELSCVLIDIDCEKVHGTSAPAPESWREQMRDRVVRLSDEHPDPYYYETRGGARIVYAQAEATILRSADDLRVWSQDYAILLAHLERCYGIVGDPACADCTRLFRLPRTVRQRGSRHENWPIWGDPDRIGSLCIEATDEDVQRASEQSKAFRSKNVLDFAPRSTSGDGLLFALLRNRGDVIVEHSSGAHVIRCPNEAAHTTGATGDGSTLLYPPAVGKDLGAICCLHGHCSGLTAKDWLSLFSAAERERAAA